MQNTRLRVSPRYFTSRHRRPTMCAMLRSTAAAPLAAPLLPSMAKPGAKVTKPTAHLSGQSARELPARSPRRVSSRALPPPPPRAPRHIRENLSVSSLLPGDSTQLTLMEFFGLVVFPSHPEHWDRE